MPRGAVLGSHQKRGLQTRQRLLDATIATLIDKGYSATSMPALCERAGLSRGAQLHHFPTKIELLTAAVEHLMAARHADLREMMRGLPQADRAERFVDELWRIYSGDTFYAFLELAVAARSDDKLRRALIDVNERFYIEAHDTLRELLHLDEASAPLVPAMARFVTSFMDGVAVNRILDDDDALSEATLALFKQTISTFLALQGAGDGGEQA
jgi:AcrR family transcriptional regulator